MPIVPTPVEDPIRAEFFGIERLEQHAESLAVAQRIRAAPGKGRPLLARVEDNGRVLRESYRLIATAIREEQAITPAAEWLVDNFHVVDAQLREIRDALPPGFYRELPKLADGPLAGYPRVYGIAWAFVAHADSRVDPESLRRFVHAYQRVQPLTMGGSCGPLPSRCAWCSSRTFGAWPSASCAGAPRARRPIPSPTSSLASETVWRYRRPEGSRGSRPRHWRRRSRCSWSSACGNRIRW